MEGSIDQGRPVEDPRACPSCRAPLVVEQGSARCVRCDTGFPRLPGGFLDLLAPDGRIDHTPFDHYLDEQLGQGAARAERWLSRQVLAADRRALDVGCGTGSIGVQMADLHPQLDVWGVDLPGNAGGWIAAGVDPERVVAGSALQLPFASGTFDLVWSLGVLEHIGEPAAPPQRTDARLRYVEEMLRVVRPGGRVIVVAPHKWFPLDPAHDWSTSQRGHQFFERTHLCLHRTWGPHPLMSYREVAQLAHRAGAQGARPLGLAEYFSFERTGQGAAGRVVPLARAYLRRLPRAAGRTPLAPYLAIELTR